MGQTLVGEFIAWLKTRTFRTVIGVLVGGIIAILLIASGQTPLSRGVAMASAMDDADKALEARTKKAQNQASDERRALFNGIKDIRTSQINDELSKVMFAVCRAQQNHNQDWLTSAAREREHFEDQYYELHRREYVRPPCDQVLIAQGWVP
jgi:predicted alpha/beta superfamily hydrolase